MSIYYVNKNPQANGDHEVHVSDCTFLPSSDNRLFLGNHFDCKSALVKARIHFPQSNGCFYCCKPCHTS